VGKPAGNPENPAGGKHPGFPGEFPFYPLMMGFL